MKRLLSLVSIFALFILGFGFQQQVKAATPVGEPVSFTLTSYFSSSNEVVNDPVVLAYGSQVSMDESLSSLENYSFLFWQVNGTVQTNLPIDYPFTVTNNLNLVGVFKPNDKFAVAFMDSNGGLIEVQYVSEFASAVEPNTSGYDKPGYVYDSAKWSVPFTGVTSDVTTVLQYVPEETPSTFALVVENGTDETVDGTGTYDLNTVATVQADADNAYQEFMYWRVGNKVVSNQSTYSFTMLQNTTITAVYGGIGAWVDEPLVTISPALSLRTGYDSFLGQYYLPAGLTYVEHGLVVHASIASPTLDDADMDQYASTKINGDTKEFLMSLDNTSGVGNVRTYLVYKDGETLHTVYSELETPELFISEYGEGSSNNKWIEIYNPTTLDVSLSDYSINLFVNGGTSPTIITLSATLKSHEAYVVYNSSSVSEISSMGDLPSGSVTFTGNDAVVLKKGSSVIDQLGVIGQDVSWNIDGISMTDHTLIRKLYVVSPNANWNPAEWVQYDQDFFDNVGFHGTVTGSEIEVSGTNSVYVGNSVSLSAKVLPRGSVQGVTWAVDHEEIALIDETTGELTGVSEGVVTITATSIEYPSLNNNTFTVSVTAVPSEKTEQIIYSTDWEDLTNINSYVASEITRTSYTVDWVFYRGNVVNTGTPISGLFNAFFRYAKSTTDSPYLRLPTAMEDITKVSFYAKNVTAGATLNVYYQIDEGSWVLADAILLTTTGTQYTVNISESGLGNTRIKFEFTYPSSSTSNRDLQIDNIVIYGMKY